MHACRLLVWCSIRQKLLSYSLASKSAGSIWLIFAFVIKWSTSFLSRDCRVVVSCLHGRPSHGTCLPSFDFPCISTSNSQCNSWLQVWAGPLSGNRLVVALWNRCSETTNITMKLPAVGLDGSAAYSVRDLWKVSQKVSIAVRCGSSVHLSSTGSTKTSSHEICIVPFSMKLYQKMS